MQPLRELDPQRWGHHEEGEEDLWASLGVATQRSLVGDDPVSGAVAST